MTGKVASNTDPCMTVDTSRAGARNWRYGTPWSEAGFAWLTYDPSPMPIATRNSTGCAKLPKIEPRHVRRYRSHMCS